VSPGEYTYTYKVKDGAGNEASQDVIVQVRNDPIFSPPAIKPREYTQNTSLKYPKHLTEPPAKPPQPPHHPGGVEEILALQGHQGGAVQADSIKTRVESAPGFSA
jgi:hypothetical protein